LVEGLPDEVRVAAAFAAALAVTFALTPVMVRVAIATGFLDHPEGYKQHGRSTPYLGGIAVLAGFIGAAALFGDGFTTYLPIVACAVGLAIVGTVDDRVGLMVTPRLAAHVAAAVVLWSTGLGWDLLPGDAADFALTLVWVVALINAFNLMDNFDGAAGTVAAVCAAGTGALAAIQGDVVLAAFTLALAGACAGFLPHNLARPARIFLGDGGSTPVGFVVAATIIAIPDGALDWATLLASAPLAGIPIFDTALVVVSRRRRGAKVLAGARDHLTHRLAAVLRSPRRVALVLGTAQGLLCLIAIQLHDLGQTAALVGALLLLAAAAVVLIVLESGPLPKLLERMS
jgi:UDP-GlcNAc:undecaprenyl-phosphate/decaprenyl-phosphate GlcNAc-1-phosphate transferase